MYLTISSKNWLTLISALIISFLFLVLLPVKSSAATLPAATPGGAMNNALTLSRTKESFNLQDQRNRFDCRLGVNWSTTTGATRYDVWIEPDGVPNSAVIATTKPAGGSTGVTLTPNPALTQNPVKDSTYYNVQVVAVNSSNTPVGASDVYRRQLTNNCSAPHLGDVNGNNIISSSCVPNTATPQITFRWHLNSNVVSDTAIAGYRIARVSGPVFNDPGYHYSQPTNFTSTGTQLVDTAGLSSSSTYTYFVESVNIHAGGTLSAPQHPQGVSADSYQVQINTPNCAPPIVTVSANPQNNIPYGGNSSISWSSSINTATCTVDGAAGFGSSGAVSKTNLTAGRSFTVSCTNPVSGQVGTGQVNVTVAPRPTATINVNGLSTTTVRNGAQVNINWSSTNATYCHLTNSGNVGTAGTVSPVLNGPNTYTYYVTCFNSVNSPSLQVSTTIRVDPPLTGTCDRNVATAYFNQGVVWTAGPSGGSGVYTYAWTGTDGLGGGGQSVTGYYNTSGNKSAAVTIRDNRGAVIDVNCSSTFIYPPPETPSIIFTPNCTSMTLDIRLGGTTPIDYFQIQKIDNTLWQNLTSGKTDTAVADNTQYYYQIWAHNPSGWSSSSGWILSPHVPNCTPLSVTPTGGCSGSSPVVNLTYPTSTGTIQGYYLWRSDNVYAQHPVNPGSFQDTNVNNNSQYYYYIKSYGPGGWSPAYINPATGNAWFLSTYTGNCTIPTFAGGTYYTNCTGTPNMPYNRVNWSLPANFGTISEVRIYRAGPEGILLAKTYNPAPSTDDFYDGITGYTTGPGVPRVLNNRQYDYYIWTRGPGGDINTNWNGSLNTMNCTPPTVVLTTGCNTNQTAFINFNWTLTNPPSPDIYNFYVKRSDQTIDGWTNNGDIRSWPAGSVANNTSYTYYVWARSNTGSADLGGLGVPSTSPYGQATIVAANCAPPNATITTGCDSSPSRNPYITISWSASSGGIDQFALRRSDNSINGGVGTATSYTDSGTGVLNNAPYTYFVYQHSPTDPVDRSGTSTPAYGAGWSPPKGVSITTYNCSPPAINRSTNPATGRSFTSTACDGTDPNKTPSNEISWTKATNTRTGTIDYYWIQRMPDNNLNGQWGTGDAGDIKDNYNNLQNNTVYRYYIWAHTSTGASPALPGNALGAGFSYPVEEILTTNNCTPPTISHTKGCLNSSGQIDSTGQDPYIDLTLNSNSPNLNTIYLSKVDPNTGNGVLLAQKPYTAPPYTWSPATRETRRAINDLVTYTYVSQSYSPTNNQYSPPRFVDIQAPRCDTIGPVVAVQDPLECYDPTNGSKGWTPNQQPQPVIKARVTDAGSGVREVRFRTYELANSSGPRTDPKPQRQDILTTPLAGDLYGISLSLTELNNLGQSTGGTIGVLKQMGYDAIAVDHAGNPTTYPNNWRTPTRDNVQNFYYLESCEGSFLQTFQGDVHSNTQIDTPGGPPR